MTTQEPEVFPYPKSIELALKLGLPSVLVIFFVWRMSALMDVTMVKMGEQHESMSRQHQDLMRDSALMLQINQQILVAQQATCVNQAKTSADQNRCFGFGLHDPK